jgi:hypothetical protein
MCTAERVWFAMRRAKVDKLGKTSCQGFKNGSYSQVCDWVKAGYGVVLNVNNGGHWVLATGLCPLPLCLIHRPHHELLVLLRLRLRR